MIDLHIYVPSRLLSALRKRALVHHIADPPTRALESFKRRLDRQRFGYIYTLDESPASDRLFRHLLHLCVPGYAIIRTTTSYTSPPHLPLHFIGPIVPS